MHEPVEKGRDEHDIAEQARPVLERAVGGDDGMYAIRATELCRRQPRRIRSRNCRLCCSTRALAS
jgi:hypothetical protein